MVNFYHIFILPKAGVTREMVEKKLNQALHWYRYNDRCYVVYTSSNESKWFARLDPLVSPTGNLFICKLDPNNYHGRMQPSFWKWFQERVKTIKSQSS